jgi:hypothetical protein
MGNKVYCCKPDDDNTRSSNAFIARTAATNGGGKFAKSRPKRLYFLSRWFKDSFAQYAFRVISPP